MHIKLFMRAKNLEVPIFYRAILQGFFYNYMDDFLGTFIHEEGFIFDRRTYKLFSFSRIFSKDTPVYDEKRKILIFNGEIWVVFSSPIYDLIRSFEKNISERGFVTLNGRALEVFKITKRSYMIDKEDVKIKTLSGITCYTTQNGKRYFFKVGGKEWNDMITLNLKNKYKILYGQEIDGDVKMEPINVSKKVTRYSPHSRDIYEEWMGVFKIKGPKELIQVAIDAGIGPKNSAGFGCVKPIS